MLQMRVDRSFLSNLLSLYLITTSIKLLLLRAPHSTDLEVHRQWKSLTYHHPLHEWYTTESHVWTLDYPPLFAYFEYFLSNILYSIHPSLTTTDHHTIPNTTEITLLRVTVLLCEPLFLVALHTLVKTLHPSKQLPFIAIAIALPGLTLVDNIHFQYNILPLSTLILTFSTLLHHKLHLSTILFSITLNLKQTFLPLSPIIAVAILSSLHHTPQPLSKKLFKLSTLAFTTLLTTVLPWIPFILNNTYVSAINRLFPIHRGLLHANWAPNLWSPYAALDLLLAHLGINIRHVETSTTSGIINNTHPFGVLPNPTPHICILLTLLSTAPFALSLFRTPSPNNLIDATAAAGLSSFLFGWHVHEKAVLLPLLPLALSSSHEAFIWLSLGGQFALLELLRDPSIVPFLIAHFVAFHAGVFAFYGVPRFAVVYFVGCLFVEAYAGVLGGHRFLFGDRMQFLPIMVVSLYAFVGVAMAYLKLVQGLLVRAKTD